MMNKHKSRLASLSGALLYTLMAGQPVLADDTEVLIGLGSPPNVLFIMDTSGSMARDVAGNLPPAAGEDSRLAIVQEVFRNLMTNEAYWGFNVGLMRFDSGGTGGYIVAPMNELNAQSYSTYTDAADNFTAGGNTPLSETLYEATRFYRGMTVEYGDDTAPGVNHPDAVNGNTYISPISDRCQENYIILLTDGAPVNDTEADNSIAGLTGSACSGNCLDELADYLHTTDHNDSLAGPQTVETYTIGFATDQPLLQSTADNGGGSYIVSNNANELQSAFDSILQTIAESNDTFSPPAMAANAFDNISHYNRLYFTLFEPSDGPKWDGNVKPYTLAGSPPEITDANNAVAVDDNGYFRDSSRSFWSAVADGGSIAAGGANGRLPAANSRNLYTYTGTYTGIAPQDQARLDLPVNALNVSPSSGLTAALLGLSNPDPDALQTQFENVIATTRSSILSDPLHSKPALVNYGGTEANPDLTLFVATNAGFIHALNASTGVEQFAFIPQELLGNLVTLSNSTGLHPYGLDGDVTAWVNDANHDGVISGSDHVYLYVGMRRGGNNYYALDVSNRNNPRLKWVIKGGEGDFAELGQSWSRPAVTSINYAGSTRKVLIFGGGYDAAQDNWPVNQSDSIGRAIYVVDANTGEKLLEVGPSNSNGDPDVEINDMTNSIPSDIRLFDSNFDGQTDRLYVGDMDGKIFRVDIQGTDSGMTGSGVLLADLGGGDGDAANNRRFYYPPDVVVTQQTGVSTYISLNIGSGYRAHPLNPIGDGAVIVNDRFYSIRDPYVVGQVPDDFSEITNDDLINVSTNLVNTDEEVANLNASSGWYIQLPHRGEKVLAPAMTLNGEIFFTTYTPNDINPNQVDENGAPVCAPPPGTGRLYRVSLFDADPVLTDVVVDGDGEPQEPQPEDRSEVLDRPGIPSEPAVMFRKTTDENGNENVELIHCEGTECEELPGAIKMEKTYWRDDA